MMIDSPCNNLLLVWVFSLRIVARIGCVLGFSYVLRIEARIDHVLELEIMYFLYVLESRTGMRINTGRIAYCIFRLLSS